MSPARNFTSVLSPAHWVVLAGVSAALHVGKLAPALPVLRDALGVSLVQAGFLLSTVQFAGMALGLLLGVWADAWGLRRSLVGGLWVLAVASWAGALAHEAWVLLLLRGIEGLGFLLVVLPAPGLIRQLVTPARLSATLGLWGTYMPVGTALALLLGPAWVHLGWQAWWLGLGSLSAVMAVVVRRVLQGSRDFTYKPPQASSGLGVLLSLWKQRLFLTLRTAGPWWVALSFAAYSSQWLAVVGLLPTMVAQALDGASMASGSSWGPGVAVCLALVAGCNALGNLAAGRLLARGWAAQHLLMLGFGSMALGAWVAFAPWASTPSAWVWLLRLAGVAMFSTVGGLIPGTLFSLAVRVAPDERTVSSTVGWMQQLSAAGQFAGPPVVAWVAARQGTWEHTWLLTGAASVLGLLLAQRIARLAHKP